MCFGGEKFFFALMAHDQSTIQTMWHINAVSLWRHQYTYVHVKKQSPRNSVAIKGMWKQCVPGALSPPPPPCLGTRLNLNTCCEAQITCYYKLCRLQNYMPSFLCGRSPVLHQFVPQNEHVYVQVSITTHYSWSCGFRPFSFSFKKWSLALFSN